MLLVEEKEGLGSLKSLFFFFTFWNTKLALPPTPKLPSHKAPWIKKCEEFIQEILIEV
jgi:hypothetical protein